MQAKDVPVNEWFMILRNKKWYKKTRTGRVYTEGIVIGSPKKHLIPNDEEVIIRK